MIQVVGHGMYKAICGLRVGRHVRPADAGVVGFGPRDTLAASFII